MKIQELKKRIKAAMLEGNNNTTNSETTSFLVDEKTGETINLPYDTEDFRGDPIKVTGFTEPHKPSSSGRIQTDQGEYFPGVAGLKIVGHKYDSQPDSDTINPGNTKDDQSKKDDYDYDSRPSHMDEAKKVDVEDNEDIDIDIEDEVNIDDESSKSEIEVDSELAGEDSEISAVLGLLTKAQEQAKSLGDEKLMDQIGNTITYYTRAHVVAEEEGMDPERFQGSGGDELDSDSIVNVTTDNPAEDAEMGFALNEEVKRFQKLAGIL